MRALAVLSRVYERVITVNSRVDARISAVHLFADTCDAIGCSE